MIFGYILLLMLFGAIASLPFILGFFEYNKPADPGPLFINLDRCICDNEEALALREKIRPAVELGLIARNGGGPLPDVSLGQKPKFHPDLGYFRLIYGDIHIPDNVEMRELLIVLGNLTIGRGCRIYGGAYSTGEIRVGPGCQIKFLVSDSDVTLAKNNRIEKWIDAKGRVLISEGCIIGKVTSESKIEAAKGCEIGEVSAKLGFEVLDSSKLIKKLDELVI